MNENEKTLKCNVNVIRYYNEENGYAILRCTEITTNNDIVIVGNFIEPRVGMALQTTGEWKNNPKYGDQFVVKKWQEIRPANIEGIEKYLGSGLVKGIGPQMAKRIVELFKENTLDIIENNIQRLSEVPGIGKKRIQQIQESWEKQHEVHNIMIFLRSYGIGPGYAAKIYKQYGNESITKIQKNPYILADEVWGIGFKTADEMAMKMGYSLNSSLRLKSGIVFTLKELAKDGHVFCQKGQLRSKAELLLSAEPSKILDTIDQMISNNELIWQTVKQESEMIEAIYLPIYYRAETNVAIKLKKIVDSEAVDNLAKQRKDIDVQEIQKQLKIEYDEIQAEAIRTAAKSKVMVLTGGPGTGKSTTINGIITAFKKYNLKILMAAPTGRAAKRMTETTGLESKTIHRLLEYTPKSGFKKNMDSPLDGDVLIIDEASMIDILLVNSLLMAIPEKMRLIFIGDIDQLPSVGPGNVLRDIINSTVIPVVHLTKIFRQAQESRIIMNAHKINKGIMPDLSNGMDTDFFFMGRETTEDVVNTILQIVSTNLPKCYNVEPTQIQVLSPMYKGPAGTFNLNKMLQQKLNPSTEGIQKGDTTFYVHDKVMQLRNNYDKDVFNGDIGYIENVDVENKTLSVNFDGKIVEYEPEDLDELVLAYCTTIHKSQGSEFPVVVMPVTTSHYIMLQRNLIYTGVTRAKKILVLVGTKKAIGMAINNFAVEKRNSLLSERLKRQDINRKQNKVYEQIGFSFT